MNSAERIRDRLADQHILLTGSTGFLAKAFLEKLLRSVDSIGSIYLLVRAKPDGTSARNRVDREVLRTRAFDRLRAALGSKFESLCKEKIHVVEGDLSRDRLGMPDEDYAQLTKKLTLLINSAATVTFDERLDWAIELNTLGPGRLLKLARDCGDIPFMHVSTCYVSGIRKGVVVEDFSAPPQAEKLLPRLSGSKEYDLEKLLDNMRADVDRIKQATPNDEEQRRKDLIDAGMDWARRHGWNDTYRFRKWIGEQFLIRDHGDLPVVVFRPAIIEGSYKEPTPGWIDGLRMADPIIVAFGRGRVNEFPARHDLPIDFIPVDYVVNAMMATLPVGEGRRDNLSLYQSCSSKRNPFMLGDLKASLEEAFRLRPMNGDDGKPIHPGELRVVDRDSFIRRWESRKKWLTRARSLLMSFNKNSRRGRKLSNAIRKIDQLIYFAKIYSPYTHLDCRFTDDNLVEVANSLHPEDRKEFAFDPAVIDWHDYIVNRHIPGVRSYVLGTGWEPTRLAAPPDKILNTPGGESFDAESLFEVFQSTAKKFPDKPALQIRRRNRWVRYTYEEALKATGTIMNRMRERGLEPGDRVALCGENCPEWGLTYFAVMRAGMTAVPLDPQLPTDDAWESARFAGAKLMCAGQLTHDALLAERKEGDAPVEMLTEPFIPAPGASLDRMPEPHSIHPTDVASILFTSGTTVAPKAVQLTHGNFIANGKALVDTHHVFPTDEFLSVLPLYHAFEFTGGFLVPLSCGATITYVEQIKGPEIVSAMNATGTTVMLVVPRLLQAFYDSIKSKIDGAGATMQTGFKTLMFVSEMSGRRFARTLFNNVHKAFGGRLRMFVSGGSRLDPELLDEYQKLGFVVYEGYGMTETAPVLTVNPPESIMAGSVGRPLANIDLEVRNTNLEGVGEIWVKGPSVMPGYMNNDAATSEILIDGWLRTGDLGRIDEGGYVYITGRSKDLIVTSAGKNVYPDEVEFRYRDLPYVKELCVLALPSADGLGDGVHAVAVIDEAAEPEMDRSSIEREIREAAATIGEKLPPYQRISAIHFWDHELPKTSTLKAKRGVIREQLISEGKPSKRVQVMKDRADTGGSKTAVAVEKDQEPAWDAIRSIIAAQSQHAANSIKPGMNLLLDLGIDSIGKLDLISRVEAQFGTKISNDQASTVARAADLLSIVGTRKPVGTPSKRDPVAWKKRVVQSDASTTPVTNGRMPAAFMPLRWAVRSGIGALMHSYVRVRAIGRENLPREGGFILAPNHSSHLDAPSVLTAVGNARRVWIAGAEDYFFNTRVKRFLFGKVLDTIPFDRRADGLQGLRRCGEALTCGDGLLLFPEGTRSITGRLQPFKTGIAVLAMEHNVPIIPVHVQNAYQLLRKGQKFIRPGTITVTFKPPIHPPTPEEIDDHFATFRDLAQQTRKVIVETSKERSA